MKSSKRIIVLSSFVVASLAVGVTFQNCAPNKLSAQSANPVSASFGTASLSSTTGEYYGSNDSSTSTTGSSGSVSSPASSSTASSSSSSTGSFGGGASTSSSTGSFGGGASTSSSRTSAVSTFVPSEPQIAILGSITSNHGLSYNDAIRLRSLILNDGTGRLPYVWSDGVDHFSVIGLTSLDRYYMDPIDALKSRLNGPDWGQFVGYNVNVVAAALGYMPNDMYRACVNSGLVVNRVTNGGIVGTSASLGCKTGAYQLHPNGQIVKWSCNCSGNFSGWNTMGAANCYQKAM